MPDANKHLQQAAENNEFLSTGFSNVDQPRWRAIVAFYTALHLLDALLDRLVSSHPETHGERSKQIYALYRAGRLDRRVRESYRTLEHLSRRARYLCEAIDLKDAEQAQKVHLPRIETYVRSSVGASRPGADLTDSPSA